MWEWLTTLSLLQWTILFGLGAALIGFLGRFAIKQGISFKRKGTTYLIGANGEKVEVKQEEVLNSLIIVEALKIKDSIQEVDDIVFRYQKRYARENLPTAQQLQLIEFQKLLTQVYKVDDDFREEFVVTHRDYLYYSLLVEKMYGNIFADIMDSFEKNGLASIQAPLQFARTKANLFLDDALQQVINSLYMGIESVAKADHDKMISSIRHDLADVIVDIFNRAIQASIKGQKKKSDLKNQIISKIGEMDGISEEQLRTLFSNVVAEDFLSDIG